MATVFGATGTWISSAVLALVVTLFVVGALPVYTVRLLVRLYPPGDPRRAELVAEMHQAIAYKDRWLWLFETVAVASIEGPIARAELRRNRGRSLGGALRAVGEYLGLLEDLDPLQTYPARLGSVDVGLDILRESTDLEDRRRVQAEWLHWVAGELRTWIEACEDEGVEPFPLPEELQQRWGAVDAR